MSDTPIEPSDQPTPTEPPRVVDRADFDPNFDPDAPIICDVCGSLMSYTGSCKLVCGNCGYVRDCEDP